MFIVNDVPQNSYPNENSFWHRETLYIGCYYKCYLPLSTHIKLHSPLNFKLIFHQQKPPLPSFFFNKAVNGVDNVPNIHKVGKAMLQNRDMGRGKTYESQGVQFRFNHLFRCWTSSSYHNSTPFLRLKTQ